MPPVFQYIEIPSVGLKNIFKNFDRALNIERYERIPTGKYNTSFYVYTDKGIFVLRIAPPRDSVFLFYERDNMLAEPEIHRLVSENTSIRVPQIYLLDESLKIIPRRYMIMEYLDAVPGVYSSFELGRILRELHEVTLDAYGYIWRNKPMSPQKDWKTAFFLMWDKLIRDIYSVGHFSKTELEDIGRILERYASVFNHNPPPNLLHMDVWYQNILVDKKGNIFLVDWDRALSGDIEIEFAVLEYCGILSNEFKRGYGDRYPDFSDPDIKIRQVFYYLYEVMKYIVIEQGRRNNRTKALSYKQYAMNLLRSLTR